ncbi:kunitz trypsin inhibitor 2-like [Coffea eugenioides]|uniref:kunitz trypsin inhibitor 2-like n=1 Tax=Coffea eugenioides TaxID=49369 RepID=UPI000F614C51|nr:kunitz trypsin inhibitor 2-like [Coffea eugenioides]
MNLTLGIDGNVVQVGVDYYIVPPDGSIQVLNQTSNVSVLSTMLRLEYNDDVPNQFFVTTGGVKGNPGRETLSNWFGIQRYEDAYIFYFCPAVCNYCRPVCGNIGVILDNGRRLLGLSNQPLKVTFKKA